MLIKKKIVMQCYGICNNKKYLKNWNQMQALPLPPPLKEREMVKKIAIKPITVIW